MFTARMCYNLKSQLNWKHEWSLIQIPFFPRKTAFSCQSGGKHRSEFHTYLPKHHFCLTIWKHFLRQRISTTDNGPNWKLNCCGQSYGCFQKIWVLWVSRPWTWDSPHQRRFWVGIFVTTKDYNNDFRRYSIYINDCMCNLNFFLFGAVDLFTMQHHNHLLVVQEIKFLLAHYKQFQTFSTTVGILQLHTFPVTVTAGVEINSNISCCNGDVSKWNLFRL